MSRTRNIKYGHFLAVVAVVLFACVITSLLTLHEHILFYQEQHSLFLYSADYMEQTVHWKGLPAYIGAFVVQFYHIPALGAAITAAILTGVYVLTELTIRNITGRRDMLQIGVAAAVALYFTLDGIDETPGWAAIALVAMLALWLLSMPMRRRRPTPPMTLTVCLIPLALAAAYIIAGFYIEAKNYDRPTRAMIRAERAIKQKKWDEALAITDQYLSTGRVNKLMFYFRNIALAEKGQLIDRIFDFPLKPGQEALAFPWHGEGREAEYGHLVHEITGDINAAHHWAFEAMTTWGETAPHLTDLARYNVALGRPKVARKFADKLAQSLFYRDEADRIMRQIEGTMPPELHVAQPDSTTIKWVNVHDFRPNLMQNYLADPGNGITRQYLIAAMLVNNDLADLMTILRPEDQKHRNLREAILIYSLDPHSTPLDTFGLEVKEETGRDFSKFLEMYKSRSIYLEEKFGKTFLYYTHIISPVNKMQKHN